MEPWIKRVLTIPVVTAALICAVAMLGAAQAKDGDRPGGSDEHEAPFGLDYVPLRGDKVDMAVRSVVLSHAGKVYISETSNGLEVKNQHILPLARIPFLGQFTDAPYERSAFADARRVASVSAFDETLFVALPDAAAVPEGVVVFNQNNAFVLREKPKAVDRPAPESTVAIAEAYAYPKDKSLLIMVRPSIILDGGLF